MCCRWWTCCRVVCCWRLIVSLCLLYAVSRWLSSAVWTLISVWGKRLQWTALRHRILSDWTRVTTFRPVWHFLRYNKLVVLLIFWSRLYVTFIISWYLELQLCLYSGASIYLLSFQSVEKQLTDQSRLELRTVFGSCSSSNTEQSISTRYRRPLISHNHHAYS